MAKNLQSLLACPKVTSMLCSQHSEGREYKSFTGSGNHTYSSWRKATFVLWSPKTGKQRTLLFIFLLEIPRAYQTNGKQHLCVNCFPWWCQLTIWDQKYTNESVLFPVFGVRNWDNLSPSRNNYTEPSVMGGADLGSSKSQSAPIMQQLISSRAFGSLQS